MGAAAENRLLVVDDEVDLCELIAESLQTEGYEVEKAGRLDDCLRLLHERKFSLVICDISLGGNREGGLVILQELQKTNTPCILISGHADYEILKNAINLKAKFFLEKPFDFSLLSKVVKELLGSGENLQVKIQALAGQAGLTGRELEIFELLARGLSNKEIAENISTSERTVKAHLSSIFRKCEVSSRAELLSRLLT